MTCQNPACPYHYPVFVNVGGVEICYACYMNQSFYHEVAMMLKKIYIKRREK